MPEHAAGEVLMPVWDLGPTLPEKQPCSCEVDEARGQIFIPHACARHRGYTPPHFPLHIVSDGAVYSIEHAPPDLDP